MKDTPSKQDALNAYDWYGAENHNIQRIWDILVYPKYKQIYDKRYVGRADLPYERAILANFDWDSIDGSYLGQIHCATFDKQIHQVMFGRKSWNDDVYVVYTSFNYEKASEVMTLKKISANNRGMGDDLQYWIISTSFENPDYNAGNTEVTNKYVGAEARENADAEEKKS